MHYIVGFLIALAVGLTGIGGGSFTVPALVLLAGLTERFVIGMPTRWISVKPSPIAIGAKPTGALPCVEPMMMNRNIIVRMISAKRHENRL